ncbi:hypothetical protein HPB47_020201 [Ixodes persulcatus]|uniref:Uncharacterized protein n=1 Tax=Ixodes persulcatus TaxID=34615 RepID=A0AC60QH16_IXOPE|nr:hypothetical protein HPB47_020201 [Ixodes persulcatus]
MPKSVCSKMEEIEALLESRNNPVMESVNKTTLNELIEFLQPSKDASDTLEEEKLGAVEIKKIKVRARHFLDTKLKISLLHMSATFLWPQFLQLRTLPEVERLEVYAHVRELLARVTEARLKLKMRLTMTRGLGLFQDWCDVEDDEAATDELEEYLHGKKDYSCSGVFEFCDF